MKILFLADGRSPTTRRYLDTVRSLGHTVHLVSSYPCDPIETVESFDVLPIAFSNLSSSAKSRLTRAQPLDAQQPANSLKAELIGRFRDTFLTFRYQLAPLTIPGSGRRFAALAKKINPDLIHALRIPYEGMTASYTEPKIPLAVSIWGNDLTFHAHGSTGMAQLTRRTLLRAAGLAADTRRDIRLGREFGLSAEAPTVVVPGNGGIDIPKMRLVAEDDAPILNLLPPNREIIINPRGFRPGSVRNDTFFQSIPAVVRQFPNVLFVCPAMANQAEARDWVNALKIERNVLLLPTLTQQDLWALFHRAKISVSVSQHDGTPNSLLEAMTIGCFPIAGDIESLREWIVPGVNGMLVDPSSPDNLSTAILSALYNDRMRIEAAGLNRERIASDAEISLVRTRIETFYAQVIER